MKTVNQNSNNQKFNKTRTNIASFNVRGLVDPNEQANLLKDMTKYKVDICCLQETKISELSDETRDKYRLILLPGKQCRHYGLGFAINEFWSQRLESYEYVSDRIAVATFKTSKRTTMKIINIYAPTQAKANENRSIREEFYDQLEATLDKIGKHTTLYIAGDFNSKIGADRSDAACIGKYARGRRNENGQQLIEFCESRQLVATHCLRIVPLIERHGKGNAKTK